MRTFVDVLEGTLKGGHVFPLVPSELPSTFGGEKLEALPINILRLAQLHRELRKKRDDLESAFLSMKAKYKESGDDPPPELSEKSRQFESRELNMQIESVTRLMTVALVGAHPQYGTGDHSFMLGVDGMLYVAKVKHENRMPDTIPILLIVEKYTY